MDSLHYSQFQIDPMLQLKDVFLFHGHTKKPKRAETAQSIQCQGDRLNDQGLVIKFWAGD